MIPGERFYQMSNAVFRYDLTPTEFMVYNYLVSCAGRKDMCWPSVHKIAVNCNCSENTVRKAVASLVRKEFIRKVTTYEDCGGRSRQTNKYIATRENVERLPDSRPPTKKQMELIGKLAKDFPASTKSDEYSEYSKSPTRAKASAYISSTLEANWDTAQRSDIYMKYIATRPRVEKLGTHGLFGDEDDVDLDAAITEMENIIGNVWTHIISLKREDAERLGYDNANAWRNLLRAHRNDISEAMRIAPNDFRWYAAFHNEGDHPHVHMMAWSVSGEGYLNPTEDCIAPKARKIEMKILPPEKMKAYLDAARDRDVLPMFYLELTTGLRKGEIVALLWSDLDEENKTISVTKQYIRNPDGTLALTEPKTETSIRQVSIPQTAVDLLKEEYAKHPDNKYMFPSPLTGEMYHPDSVVNIHKKLLKAAGIEHLRFHDLRHTFATTALQNGVDVKTVSTMLGHYDAGFTLRTYTHATRQMQDKAAETMGNFMEQVM